MTQPERYGPDNPCDTCHDIVRMTEQRDALVDELEKVLFFSYTVDVNGVWTCHVCHSEHGETHWASCYVGEAEKLIAKIEGTCDDPR